MKKLLVIIPENLISATGWTLLHSLWQFTAILLIISILRYIYKRHSILKYWFSIIALGLQLITSIITFVMIFEPRLSQNKPEIADTLKSNTINSLPILSNNFSSNSEFSWWQNLQISLADHLDWFVNIWIFGIIFFSVRLIGGYFYTQNLKWKHTKFVDETLQKTFDTLLEKIKLSKPVYLLESSLAKVPMTIGHLETVILLPVGLATGLTTKELEAILSHELAHIKRSDYLTNMLQSAVEIIFFYHPATWWLSTKISEDRENCCDDMALNVVNDKISLAKALTHVESHRQKLLLKESASQEPNLAMTFGEKHQTFSDRIKRIIGINNSKPMSYSNWIVAAIMIVLVAVVGVYSQKNEQVSITSIEIMMPQKGKFEVFFTRISSNSSNSKQVFAVKNELGQVYRKSWEADLNNIEEKLFDEFIENIKAGKESPVAKFSTEMEVEIYTKRMLAHEPYIPISDTLALENAEKEMQRLHQEMQKYSAEVQKYSEILQQKYSKDLGIQSNEMQEITKKMRLPEKKIKEMALKMQEIELSIQKIENKYDDEKMPADAQKKLSELQQREQEVQNKMQKYEAEMQKIEQEMEFVEQKIERVQQPMDSVSSLMERYSQPMDSIGKLMEKQGAEIEHLAKIEEEKFKIELANFGEYLYKEGLIKNKKNYEIRVKGSKMLIDLAPQPTDVYDKIWSIIKQRWGKRINLEGKDLEIRVKGNINSFNVHSEDANTF